MGMEVHIMGRQIKVRCSTDCSGCDVLPMTQSQYNSVVNSYKTSPNKATKDMARKILTCRVVKAYCAVTGTTSWVEIEGGQDADQEVVT